MSGTAAPVGRRWPSHISTQRTTGRRPNTAYVWGRSPVAVEKLPAEEVEDGDARSRWLGFAECHGAESLHWLIGCAVPWSVWSACILCRSHLSLPPPAEQYFAEGSPQGTPPVGSTTGRARLTTAAATRFHDIADAGPSEEVENSRRRWKETPSPHAQNARSRFGVTADG